MNTDKFDRMLCWALSVFMSGVGLVCTALAYRILVDGLLCCGCGK